MNNAQQDGEIYSLTTPVKRVKKLYVDNDDLEVPRRTRNRWKKKRESEMEALFSQSTYTYSSQEADLGSCEQPTVLQSPSSMDLSGESLSSSCSNNSLSDSSDAEFSSGTDILSDTDTSSDTEFFSDTELSSSSEGHGTETNSKETNSAFFLANEFESLKIISCFRRHNHNFCL
ncbi:hypothetical protein KUTeg_017677 [Tegillarca granosa]|uniref:Uncharacterized protein n=1 Tax=Tegillarca granosa TaxID=220873 RepID=A0ABQ9EH93_TEGGR|nr:hypothetical protein KUTeg_017677 [Tegillarca granosa]